MVSFFLKKYKILAQRMMTVNHYVNADQPNIYHAEGSVWTHTMCVLTCIDFLVADGDDRLKLPLYLAALLHDIGKVETQELKEANVDKPIRYSFHNHEAVSVFKSLDILKAFKQAFNLSDYVIETTIKIIGLHGTALAETYGCDIQEHREIFRQADKMGAVRHTEAEGDYDVRKMAKRNPEPNKEAIFMIGLPNSGKSTYIKEHFADYHVISRDDAIGDFYLEVMGNFKTDYNIMYKDVHSPENLDAFNKFFDEKVKKARAFDKIVIDMTMMSLKSRRGMATTLSKHTVKAIFMATDMETIDMREKSRASFGKAIPSFVYDNMIKSFSFPTYAEFADIKVLTSF